MAGSVLVAAVKFRKILWFWISSIAAGMHVTINQSDDSEGAVKWNSWDLLNIVMLALAAVVPGTMVPGYFRVRNLCEKIL